MKIEENGGRIETRTSYISHEIDWLEGKESWKNLVCIGAIHTEFEKDGKKSSEWHYYISSAPLTAELLLYHIRLEWGVEAIHWLLDVHLNKGLGHECSKAPQYHTKNRPEPRQGF